ncbi:-Spindle pole body component 110 [Babesia bigemina]|uniref:-Spindle pole body component 110 n=1 Tax=Babesia bigemina TaxID=5866 RepID=A0A061DB77_BABBI|nr:-Spindle pole body component 110 [Babesia bigemina]CDR97941.1 -Spindle pole body component 110 [Babesia bigemina]|eukprot:XP_012770127.1 -Spindle pole body component 110 [Babesia bigemina]
METRLQRKLREIIAEITGNRPSDYARSLREEHRDGMLQGNKAYAIDNGGRNITLFIPWRLHGPLESSFRSMAGGPHLLASSFRQMVDDAALFPGSQNARKKEDIINYILERVIGNLGAMDFEQFLHALFLLSKYRASVLRVTEQCAFNHVIALLMRTGDNVPPEGHYVRVDYGQQPEVEGTNRAPISQESTESIDPLVEAMSNVSLERQLSIAPSLVSNEQDVAIGHEASLAISEDQQSDNTICTDNTVPEEPAPVPVPVPTSVPEPVSRAEKPVAEESSVCQPSQNDHLIKITEDKMNETCEIMKTEIMSLRNRMDEYKFQETQKQELLRTISALKDNNSQLQARMEENRATAEETRVGLEAKVNELQNQLPELQSRAEDLEKQLEESKAALDEANQKIDQAKFQHEQHHSIQTMLALQDDYESMLFSAFVSYRDDELCNGEFVMSENSCINFCLDFGLGDAQLTTAASEEPVAKMAYREVCKRAPDGKLTYALFKEFLLRLAEIIDPQSTQKRAFQLLLL